MSELLTEDEKNLVSKLAECADLFAKIVGKDEPIRVADLNEACTWIHNLQNMVLSQAAARAYPTKYRLMGERVQEQKRPKSFVALMVEICERIDNKDDTAWYDLTNFVLNASREADLGQIDWLQETLVEMKEDYIDDDDTGKVLYLSGLTDTLAQRRKTLVTERYGVH